MNPALRACRDFFVSLRLTIVLLVLGMVLVFAATLAQVDIGVWGVQQEFFRSFVAFWRVGRLVVPLPGGYLVGGFLLINLIAAHLYRFKLSWRKLGIVVAHLGLILLLVGELLTGLWQQEYNMRLNEGETKNYAESYQHVELALVDVSDPHTDDVVAIPESYLARRATVQHPKLPFRVVVRDYYPNASLVMRPSAMGGAAANDTSPATTGIGLRVNAISEPITYKQDERNTPAAYVELVGAQGSIGTWMVSAQIPTPQHFSYDGHEWKLALRFARQYEPFTITLRKFSHDVYPGTDIPKNFSSRVHLRSDDGREDRDVLIYMNNPLRYAGLTFYQSGYEGEHTTILQVVRNPSWLLPYLACGMVAFGLLAQFGLSLFGFVNKRRKRTAEKNVAPAPAEPSRRPAAPAAPAHPRWAGWIPWLVLLSGIGVLVGSLIPAPNPGAFDIASFGRLPVLANGRFKPLDTVARSSLLQFQNRQRVSTPTVEAPLVANPTEWLLDVVYRPEKADTYPTFVIDNPELLTLIGQTEDSLRIRYDDATKQLLAAVGFMPGAYRRFSFKQIEPHLQAIEEQSRLADQVDSANRNAFQRAVLQLYNSLLQYQRLRHMFVMPGVQNFLGDLFRFQEKLADGVAAVRAKQAGQPHDEALVNQMLEMGQRFDVMATASTFLVIPSFGKDADPNRWETTGAALLETFQTGQLNPAALAYAGLGRAWRENEPQKFNQLLHIFRGDLEKRFQPQLHKSDIEVRFNGAEPFYQAMILYAFAFVLAIASWLVWPQPLGKAAFWLVGVAWLATTAGILTRMWLEGRPPVTNLYSSALFIGWGAVALCLVLEYVYRSAIGSAAAGAVGFATLIIAHMLSLSGDTLEMMRAVLDSNFWLATHVVVVTLGYASTFLAGFLALIYVIMGVTTRWLLQRGGAAGAGAAIVQAGPGTASDPRDTNAKILERMVYGIVCFATLFSFAGTVLGGIWADQSWGRFWGWDPKENGALIIVVWNAIILHARWAGLVRQRGLMNLAIFGNIVTSWSWFGTNMLGVGLHSYGFTDAAFWLLSAFVASQLTMIAVGLIPLERWRSFRPKVTMAPEQLASSSASP